MSILKYLIKAGAKTTDIISIPTNKRQCQGIQSKMKRSEGTITELRYNYEKRKIDRELEKRRSEK